MVRSLFLCILICCQSLTVCAQDNGQDKPTVVEKYGPRRQISTIVYMGLAGAVLGLSTLSFYGRPQDKLTNIPIGFGIGVVIGTIYMTYQAATNPNEFYRESQYPYQPNFHQPGFESKDQVLASYLQTRPQPLSFAYQWSF